MLARHGAAQEQFLEEARITGQLQHPGIPPVNAAKRFSSFPSADIITF
jgi:hypothetical protein